MHENTCRAESHKYQSLERFVATLRHVSVFNCTLLIYQKKRIVAERNRDHLILKHRREDASRQSIFVVNYL